MVPSHAALDTRWCQDLHGLLLHRDRRTVALDPPGLALEGRSAHWARSRGRRCTFVGLVRQRVVGRVELLSYSCKLSSFTICTLQRWKQKAEKQALGEINYVDGEHAPVVWSRPTRGHAQRPTSVVVSLP